MISVFETVDTIREGVGLAIIAVVAFMTYVYVKNSIIFDAIEDDLLDS